MERLNWEPDKKPAGVTVRKLAGKYTNKFCLRNHISDFLSST